VVVIVGYAGRAARKLAGSAGWEAVATQTNARLDGTTGVVSVNATHLYAVGEKGVIVRSRDHASTWELQGSNTTNNLHGVWAADSEVFAVGDSGTILHSRDYGSTWEREESGTSRNLYNVWGTASDDVYVVGEGFTILRRR
jgi:photosystem II stability/assembly factor-like uncharacterized protein